MITSKSLLVEYLKAQCKRIVLDKALCKEIYTHAKETYGMPRGLTSDLISERRDLTKETEFILFVLFESLQEKCKLDKKLDNFFATQEIKFYKESKYKDRLSIKFPLIFKMIQINEDQWIGDIDIQTLMKLRKAQLINYNSATQRVLKKVVKGETEEYQIALNQKSVKEIKESFEKGEFISNTITLNIPLDTESSFYYNPEKCELVINRLECFHIVDGFHRFISASQAHDLNEEFNYKMELRIANWEEAKAQTFIWQDNHKTFMQKANIESYNMNKESNLIVERLNNNVLCNIKGLINRNDGIINFGDLSDLINWFYLKNTRKRGNAFQVKIVKEIVENLNTITELDSEYIDKKWDYNLTLATMCVFDLFNKTDKDKSEMDIVIKKVYERISNSEDKVFKVKGARKILINKVNNIIEEVIQ